MDLLSIGMFVLKILGIVYSTIFSYFEYRMERVKECDDILNKVATEEVFYSYVWPCLYDKLHRWKDEGLSHSMETSQNSHTATYRRRFCDLRRAMRLSEEEFSKYKTLCKESMVRRIRWNLWFPLDDILDDVCSTYM